MGVRLAAKPLRRGSLAWIGERRLPSPPRHDRLYFEGLFAV
jgi:hypothetical protein